MEYFEISKDGLSTFMKVIKYANENLDMKLLSLTYLLVSQLNKCSYCVDVHFKECIKNEIDTRKLNSILTFKDSIFFSEEEILVLSLAEKITMLSGEYRKEIENLKKFFTEKQIVDLVFAISNMNAMNRIAITFERKPSK